MTSPIDTVSVEVGPDFSDFDNAVRNAVGDAGRVIENELEQALNSVAREADDAGDKIGREFQQGGERAEDALDEVGDKGEREFDRIEREADDANRGIGSSFGKLAGIIAGAFAAVQIGQFFKDAALEAQALNSAMANTEQIIQSTGGAAGLATEDVRELSRSLSLEIGVDSLAVQEASNVLLTFRNVSEDVFDRSIGLAADMSAVFGTDLSAASLQLGKALNDPIQGISALSRVGVTFTEQQEEQIRALTESGDVMGAQNIILEELEAQVGGTAAASADSTAKISNAFTELQRALGGPLIAAIDQIAPALISITEGLEPVFGAIGEVVGGLITQLAPILDVLGAALAEGLQALLPAIEPVGAAVLAVVEAFAPLLPIIGELLGTLLPPLAQVITLLANALAPIIELVADLASELLSRLAPVFDAIMPIIEEVVGVLGDALAAILPVIIDLFLAVVDATLPLVPVMLDLLRAILPILDPIIDLIQRLLPPLVNLLTTLLTPIIALLDPILQLATILITALVEGGLTPLIEIIADLLVPLLTLLTDVLNITLVPALEFVSQILEGNFSEAFQNAGGHIGFIRDVVMAVFNFIQPFISGAIDFIVDRFNEWREGITIVFNFVRDIIQDRVERVVAIFRFLRDVGTTIFNFVRRLIQNRIEAIARIFRFLRDVAVNIFNRIRNFIRDRINAIVAAANRIREFVNRVRNFFNRARDAVRNRINAIIRLVRGIPGRIRRAIGNAGRILRQAGRNIIQGLINGIRSMIGNVRDAIGGVAQEIRDALPFSPAKYGPLSGRGSPDIAGQIIVQMLARGMESQRSMIRRSSALVAGSVQSGLTAAVDEIVAHVGAGGNLFEDFSFRGASSNVGRFNDQLADMFAREDEAFTRRNVLEFLRNLSGDGVRVRSGDAAQPRVILELRGDDSAATEAVMFLLRKGVRVQGGDVQTVLGTGSRRRTSR